MQNLGALQVLWLSILRSPSTSLRLGLECLVTTLVVRFLGNVVDEAAVHVVVAAVATAVLAAQQVTVFFLATFFMVGSSRVGTGDPISWWGNWKPYPACRIGVSGSV